MSLTVLSVGYPLARVSPTTPGGAEQVLALLDEAVVAAGGRSLVVAPAGSQCHGRLLETLCLGTTFDEQQHSIACEVHRRDSHARSRFLPLFAPGEHPNHRDFASAAELVSTAGFEFGSPEHVLGLRFAVATSFVSTRRKNSHRNRKRGATRKVRIIRQKGGLRCSAGTHLSGERLPSRPGRCDDGRLVFKTGRRSFWIRCSSTLLEDRD